MQPQEQSVTEGTVMSIAPRLLSVSSAVLYSATSRAKLYEEMKAGNLRFIKLDSATRIEVTELDRWIDSKSAQPQAA